jgi:glycosyltransferase involved in cell wall biosynthesis
MSAPKLTIGIAVFDDFSRLHMMIQVIRMLHSEALPDCELIIVDNNPASLDGQQLKPFLDRCNPSEESFKWVHSEDGKVGGSFADAERWAFGHGITYVPFKDVAGTAPAKQKIFEAARGDAVLVMDAHIIPFPGTLRRLIDFYRDNPETNDLYQGPYAEDSLISGYGSMRAGWGGTMNGKWQIDARSHNAEDPPFEIWGHGMGFFSCRRLAWVGFNPRFRGFGGEEGYIHEKFRQAGAKCWSLPWLRMWHSYGMRDDQRTNPMDQESTLWNNIVGHLEVGWDLAEMKAQYLSGNEATKSPKIPEALWDKTLAAALADTEPPRMGYWKSLEDAFQASATTSPDFSQHVPTLRDLARLCESAVELTHHGHGTVGLLAGLADREGTSLTTIHEAPCGETDRLVDVAGKCSFKKEVGKWTGRSIPKCDLLFIDTRHNAGQLSQELMEHAPNVRKFIVLHDTNIYGEKGDNGGPGLMHAIRGYLAWSGLRWSVYSHTKEQYGLTVLMKGGAEGLPIVPKVQLTPGPGLLAKPSNGTGTILMKMFEAMGVEKKADCDCQGTANNMDLWGVAGCRSRYNQIVGTLKDGQYRWGWAEKIKAGMNAMTKLGIVLNPLDPFPQLLDRALADAEKWEAGL